MKKITIAAARREYAKGTTLYLLPNKVAFQNPWITPTALSNATGMTFEQVSQHYRYYNCVGSLGTTIAYYVVD